MKEKKLISIRVDADILAHIDQYAKHWRYWKRSAVINNILEAVVKKTDSKDFDMIARYPSFKNRVRKISVIDSSM